MIKNINIITVSQKKLLISEVIKRLNLCQANSIQTPMEKNLHLIPYKEPNVHLLYRKLIGCFLYISFCSRPDISYGVNYLSHFMNSYSETHSEHLKRIVKYLKRTEVNKEPLLSCNVGADWASEVIIEKQFRVM